MVDKTVCQNQEGPENPSRTFWKERTSPLSWKVLLLLLLFPVAVTQFFHSLPTLKSHHCSLIPYFLMYVLPTPDPLPHTSPILQKLPSYTSAHFIHERTESCKVHLTYPRLFSSLCKIWSSNQTCWLFSRLLRLYQSSFICIHIAACSGPVPLKYRYLERDLTRTVSYSGLFHLLTAIT